MRIAIPVRKRTMSGMGVLKKSATGELQLANFSPENDKPRIAPVIQLLEVQPVKAII